MSLCSLLCDVSLAVQIKELLIYSLIISLFVGDLARSDQGHLLKNRVSERDSAIVTKQTKSLGSRIGWHNRIDLS